MLALPAAKRLAELDQSSREVIEGVLRDLARDAARRAERSWRYRKAPLAVYWRAVSVYSRHIVRAMRTISREEVCP